MLFMGAANYLKGYSSGYACQGMTHDLRMGYARYLLSLPLNETEERNAGEQLSRLQNEITGVSGYLHAHLLQLFDDGIRFLTTLIWLMLLSPALTLMTTLPALIVVIYVFWSSKIIGSATGRCQAAIGQMNKQIELLLSLFPMIRLFDATRFIRNGYTSAVKEWEKQTILLESKKAWLMSLSGVLSSIPLLFLFLFGGHMAINGVMTVGTLYMFLNLSGNVSGVLMNLPGHIAAFRQFAENMKRISPHVLMEEAR
jgi:ABC-type bacteriocin/lantibiotic exporter with double-glycine peptidase domain